jgi:hypothetical protein
MPNFVSKSNAKEAFPASRLVKIFSREWPDISIHCVTLIAKLADQETFPLRC